LGIHTYQKKEIPSNSERNFQRFSVNGRYAPNR
jgi:hypothetical protein